MLLASACFVEREFTSADNSEVAIQFAQLHTSAAMYWKYFYEMAAAR
jgi:hypothetical protein